MSAEKKLTILQDEPSKYHFKTKDDQRIDIEHRDGGIILDLFKWGNEASLRLNLNIVLADTHQFSKNKIEIDTAVSTLRVYPIDTRSTGNLYGDNEDYIQCQDGGVRFELVLKAKPIRNYFTIPVSSKNLRFSLQPFLTQEDRDAGASCSLNVEDSYAVYHISKKNGQYKTGKAFHVYRPIAEDALGNKAWCIIRFDKYLDPTSLTLTIPQQFLDEATYPITVDPDFGYQVAGTNWLNIAFGTLTESRRAGSAWTMPVGGGTANWIKAYVRRDAGVGDVDCKAFINQRNSGGAGIHAQIATKENLACEEVAHWEQFTLSDEALTGGVIYILNISGDPNDVGGNNYQVARDWDGQTAIDSYYEAGVAYGAPESPWTAAADGFTVDYSIYCNYDAPTTTTTTTTTTSTTTTTTTSTTTTTTTSTTTTTTTSTTTTTTTSTTTTTTTSTTTTTTTSTTTTTTTSTTTTTTTSTTTTTTTSTTTTTTTSTTTTTTSTTTTTTTSTTTTTTTSTTTTTTTSTTTTTTTSTTTTTTTSTTTTTTTSTTTTTTTSTTTTTTTSTTTTTTTSTTTTTTTSTTTTTTTSTTTTTTTSTTTTTTTSTTTTTTTSTTTTTTTSTTTTTTTSTTTTTTTSTTTTTTTSTTTTTTTSTTTTTTTSTTTTTTTSTTTTTTTSTTTTTTTTTTPPPPFTVCLEITEMEPSFAPEKELRITLNITEMNITLKVIDPTCPA